MEAHTLKERQILTHNYRMLGTKMAIAYYIALTLANMLFGDQPPWENDEGHKLDLKLPWKKDGRDQYWSFPFGRPLVQLFRLIPASLMRLLGVEGETSTGRWIVNKLGPTITAIMEQVGIMGAGIDIRTGEKILPPEASIVEVANAMVKTAFFNLMPMTAAGAEKGRYTTPAEWLAPLLTGGTITSGAEGGTRGRQISKAQQREQWEKAQEKNKLMSVSKNSPEARQLAREYFKRDKAGKRAYFNPSRKMNKAERKLLRKGWSKRGEMLVQED
jgi:hypothetical protein